MTYINWGEKFSVKVKEIDEQHKKLIEITNKIHYGFKNVEIQKTVINAMTEYAKVHFETEEQYMLQFEFPGYAEHKKEHEELTEKTKAIKNTFERTNCLLSLAILDFLNKWIENHLLNMDMKYVSFFIEKGLQ